LFSLLVACGGGSSTTATTSGGESGAPHVTGACYAAQLGVCQYYYGTGQDLTEAQTACTESDVPDTSGSWLPDCPRGNRLGECADANNNPQARFYAGGSLYTDAAAAETACEADSGTWVP